VEEDSVYDAIVVGARCAGSPLAMLLARQGHRVLILDRASFPSDTLSTHALKVAACARLQRWGLLDRVVATNAPPIRRGTLDLGPFALSGCAPARDAVDFGISVRRTLLDKLLLDEAVAAGAEVREQFTVDELTWGDDRVTGIRGHGRDGAQVTEQATVVIGADGLHSLVARAVKAPVYNDRGTLTCAYYSYWSDVPVSGVEFYPRGPRIVIAFPTNDELTAIYTGWPVAEFDAFRTDVEGNYRSTIALAGSLAERVERGRLEERIYGTADIPNFFRKPYGPGWALVGDAGYHKDPITAQGITDAFRDADLLAAALDEGLRDPATLDGALARYEGERNADAMPVFEFICREAALTPPPPETLQLFGALQGNQPQIDRLMGVIENTVWVEDFFSPQNIGAIMAAAGAPAPA
jgi:flavin-dependent dehydrogenase